MADETKGAPLEFIIYPKKPKMRVPMESDIHTVEKFYIEHAKPAVLPFGIKQLPHEDPTEDLDINDVRALNRDTYTPEPRFPDTTDLGFELVSVDPDAELVAITVHRCGRQTTGREVPIDHSFSDNPYLVTLGKARNRHLWYQKSIDEDEYGEKWMIGYRVDPDFDFEDFSNKEEYTDPYYFDHPYFEEVYEPENDRTLHSDLAEARGETDQRSEGQSGGAQARGQRGTNNEEDSVTLDDLL